jgi:hypothetical protein
MKIWIRATALAAACLLPLGAQAALVKFVLTGVVTFSGTFPDGSVVPLGTPVTGSYTYDSITLPEVMDRREDGSGFAQYAIPKPYHFRLRAGGHRVRAEGFRVHLFNDLNQPFGDEYDVRSTAGAWLDGAWHPGARFDLSFVSEAGHLDALGTLKLPRRVDLPAFDAFRTGRVAGPDGLPLLMLEVSGLRSHVCAAALPGTDDCAPE